MIDILGLLYGIAKDAKNYLEWKEEIKIVDNNWIEKSSFGYRINEQGFKLRWSNPEKIETRLLEGYQIIYEFDKIKRIRRKIQLGNRKGSSILIGIKENA